MKYYTHYLYIYRFIIYILLHSVIANIIINRLITCFDHHQTIFFPMLWRFMCLINLHQTELQELLLTQLQYFRLLVYLLFDHQFLLHPHHYNHLGQLLNHLNFILRLLRFLHHLLIINFLHHYLILVTQQELKQGLPLHLIHHLRIVSHLDHHLEPLIVNLIAQLHRFNPLMLNSLVPVTLLQIKLHLENLSQ